MRKVIKIDPKLKIDKIEDVLNEPKIVRVENFEPKDAASFENDMSDAIQTGQPVVPVVIDSYGGQVYSCIGMISAIERCPVPVATIVTSKAMSAGALLFCFGTEGYRFMDKNAYLMIHDVGSFAFGKVEDIKADAKHLDYLNQTMYKRVAKHTGHPENFVLDLIKKEHNHVDWFLTAKDAKKYNFANHLKVPKFEISVDLNVSFG